MQLFGFLLLAGTPLLALATNLQASRPASPEELKRLTTDLFKKWDEHQSRKQVVFGKYGRPVVEVELAIASSLSFWATP